MRWLLLAPGGEDISAKHVKFSLIRERKDINSRGVELVVGDVDQPGAEETSPANCQHDMDVVRGQTMVNAVGILDLHSFFDIMFSKNGQTEKIMMTYEGIFIFLYYPTNMMKNIRKYIT